MNQIGQLALISLGSNADSIWGDAKETVKKALAAVAKLSQTPAKHSHLYATPAFPVGAGPDFVNAAVAIYTTASAHAILADLHEIEAQAGRIRSRRWAQRSLDLDLIALSDALIPDTDTHAYWRKLPMQAQLQEAPAEPIVPHPRMQDRSFVLVPLADVAPDWVHPVLGKSVLQLRDMRPGPERASVTRLD